jgi:type VI secretion system protein ImpA
VEQPVRSQESASGSDSEWQQAGKLATGGDAVQAAIAAARFLFRANPSDPVPYLLVRALRWGELRGAAPEWNGLLAAPPPELRIALRNSAKSADWKGVLGIAEDAMSAPCGRAWLDLQRYTITACEQLKYETVARCLRSELRLLLTDLPNLVAATLVDDTGTANPDTLSWLRAGGFIS